MLVFITKITERIRHSLMDTSDLIATLALAISLGSLYVSVQSLKNSEKHQKSTDQKVIENEKTELLKQISENKSILNKARIDIGALKAEFEAQPQPTKSLLVNFTDLFTEFLPSIESAIDYLEKEHKNISLWNHDISYSDIMRHKSQHNENYRQFETSYEQAVHCVVTFREKLEKAKQSHSFNQALEMATRK